MIIRIFNETGAEHLRDKHGAPDGVGGIFGRLDVLRFTSTELRTLFGISLADTDVGDAFALAEALRRHGDRPTSLERRNDKLARVLQQRAYLFPCFVGYQDVPEVGLLPFMSDGPSAHWSMFFEADGRMTLAEGAPGSLFITTDDALHKGHTPDPEPAHRSFLLNPLQAARRAFSAARSLKKT